MNKYFSLHGLLNQDPEEENEEDSVSKEIINIINNKKASYPWPTFFTELRNSIFYYGIDKNNLLHHQHIETDEEKLKTISKQIKELEPRIEKLSIIQTDLNFQGERFVFNFTLKNDQYKKIHTLLLKNKFNSNLFPMDKHYGE